MARNGYSTFPKVQHCWHLTISLVSYPEHSLEWSYSSAETQSAYSISPTDWVTLHVYRYTKITYDIHICTCIQPDIGVMVRVFSNGQGDLGSIPGRVIPKTLKMVLDASLLNTQHYKARIKGKVEKSWERSRVLPYTLV